MVNKVQAVLYGQAVGDALGLPAEFKAYRATDRLSPRERFREALEAVILAGGDADTNGAVAGAMLGAYLGMERIPEVLVKGLVGREALDQRLLRLLATYPKEQRVR